MLHSYREIEISEPVYRSVGSSPSAGTFHQFRDSSFHGFTEYANTGHREPFTRPTPAGAAVTSGRLVHIVVNVRHSEGGSALRVEPNSVPTLSTVRCAGTLWVQMFQPQIELVLSIIRFRPIPNATDFILTRMLGPQSCSSVEGFQNVPSMQILQKSLANS